MYLLLKWWCFGRSMKVHTAMSIKDTESDSQLVWKQVIKRSPCYYKISFPMHLLKHHPASSTTNIYAAKYLYVTWLWPFQKLERYKQASDACRRPRFLATSFLSCYLCQWNPLKLGWNSAYFTKNQTATVVLLAITGNMLTKILYSAKLKQSCTELFGGYRRKFWKFQNYSCFWWSQWLKQPQ